MELLDAQPELLRLAAHFVERSQTIVNVEHRVLESLGHDRAGSLLKLEHEMRVRLARWLIEILRKSEEQNVAQKIEDGFFDRRITSLSRGDCALDHLSILLAHRLARREISSINRKTRDRLLDGAAERFQREIAKPTILLGKPIDHVCENIDIARHRQSHYLQLFCVEEMTEMERVTDEAMERFRDRSFGRRIDQQLSGLIREIVTGSTVNRPTLPQHFRAGENFFQHHVDGARVGGRSDPNPFGTATLKLLEVFLRLVETVWMIDAQSGNRARADKIEKQLVRCLENFRHFHSDRSQIVDIEKAAIIDFLRGDAPERQPI